MNTHFVYSVFNYFSIVHAELMVLVVCCRTAEKKEFVVRPLCFLFLIFCD